MQSMPQLGFGASGVIKRTQDFAKNAKIRQHPAQKRQKLACLSRPNCRKRLF
jgi:hypothetical protein